MELFSDLTVTCIDEVTTVPVLRGRKTLMKERKNYGISFCERGRITYLHNGKEYVSDPAHAILLPMGQTYVLHCDAGGRFPLINFRTSAPISEEFVRFPLRNPSVFLHDFRELADAYLLRSSHLGAMSVFYNILRHLAASVAPSENDLLRPAVAYLEENYADPSLNNARMAAAAHISEVYLRRLFREAYGVTPHRYLMDLRIKVARQMLAGSYASVSEVAEQCGFSGVYHFCRAFRTATGMTPTEYTRSFGEVKI